MKTTWKKLIEEVMEARGETLADLEDCTLSEDEMNAEFNNGYGGTEGTPFTAWTKNTVYFPVQYDGSEWVGFVARNPDGIPSDHQGGG